MPSAKIDVSIFRLGMWDVESDLKRIPGPTVGFQWCQADLEGFIARPAETRPEARKEAGLWID